MDWIQMLQGNPEHLKGKAFIFSECSGISNPHVKEGIFIMPAIPDIKEGTVFAMYISDDLDDLEKINPGIKKQIEAQNANIGSDAESTDARIQSSLENAIKDGTVIFEKRLYATTISCEHKDNIPLNEGVDVVYAGKHYSPDLCQNIVTLCAQMYTLLYTEQNAQKITEEKIREFYKNQQHNAVPKKKQNPGAGRTGSGGEKKEPERAQQHHTQPIAKTANPSAKSDQEQTSNKPAQEIRIIDTYREVAATRMYAHVMMTYIAPMVNCIECNDPTKFNSLRRRFEQFGEGSGFERFVSGLCSVLEERGMGSEKIKVVEKYARTIEAVVMEKESVRCEDFKGAARYRDLVKSMSG